MSGQDVLSQDEIDALLHGVDSGAVATEDAATPGEARTYDFANQVRIVRGRMPTLEMVNERFARLFRTSLFTMSSIVLSVRISRSFSGSGPPAARAARRPIWV